MYLCNHIQHCTAYIVHTSGHVHSITTVVMTWSSIVGPRVREQHISHADAKLTMVSVDGLMQVNHPVWASNVLHTTSTASELTPPLGSM